MPGSCAPRPPWFEPGRASRRRLRGWEQREIAQLASALGASGVVSFRVHGVQVQLQHDTPVQGAEQQQAHPAASPEGTADPPPTRRQQKRQLRSAARAAAFRDRRRAQESSTMGIGASCQPPSAAPHTAAAAVAHEQCSSQHGAGAKPRPAFDTRGSPANSPDRKRQALACHVADTIPSGSFGVQVHPRKRVERKFEEFLAELANEAAKRGL